jgi:isocitrate lyase
MRLQNRFKTGLDIARYTAKYTALMRATWRPMTRLHQVHPVARLLARLHRPAEADLGQEALRHDRSPLSVSLRLDDRGAALRVRAAARPVDAREDLGAGADRRALHLPASGRLARAGRYCSAIDRRRARPATSAKEKALIEKIDNFQTHVVPVIADIDAGFGNAEATYLLAKKMIEAGACACRSKIRCRTKSSAATRTAR